MQKTMYALESTNCVKRKDPSGLKHWHPFPSCSSFRVY